MDSIYITGGKPLKGKIPISGAKNAALTLMPCALLTDEKVTLENLPRLADCDNFSHLLNQLGVSTSVAGVKKGEYGRKMTLQASEIASTVAPYDMVRRMRASILVLGPMLARAGESTVSLPGGCAIGDRPIDLHLHALEAMGAKIDGIGSSHLTIDGVEGLHGATHTVMPDRIEAGSYACAAGITGGELDLVGARHEDMLAITNALAASGLMIEFHEHGMKVMADGPLKPLALSTAPFPAFPTDMQAQFMAMLSLAKGESYLEETIFENRYMHVPELRRMGANIEVRGRSALVHGVERMTGAQVMATDLRASMSLVLAGLAAEGDTEVLRVYHLDRGYERLEEKLSAVGAQIERRSAG